jgi:hypothetical protein
MRKLYMETFKLVTQCWPTQIRSKELNLCKTDSLKAKFLDNFEFFVDFFDIANL